MSFVRGWVALAGTTLACAASRPTRNLPSATNPVHASAPATRQSADSRVASAIAQVVRLRHLALETPLNTKVVSRDTLVHRALEELDAGFPVEVAAATEEFFFGLGLVDAGFDYRRETVALLGHELGGLYDGGDRTLYVDASLSGDEGRAALAHEIVHALQDQHFGLGRYSAWHSDETDALSAAHAVAEGEATSVMFDALLEGSGKTALELSDGEIAEDIGNGETPGIRTPGVLARSLVAPYVDGTLFVHRLRRAGGWTAVDSVWARMPESTEQLLHADKWASREAPESVPIAQPSDPAWRVAYHDVLGEQGVRIVLAEWNTPAEAALAAAGWSGDRIAVLANGVQRRVVWHIRYDTKDASARGFDGFTRSPDFSGTAARSADDARCVERVARGLIAIVVAGRELVLATGPFVRTDPALPSEGCEQTIGTARRAAAQQ